MSGEKWFFLAFRPSYVPLEEIVGGDQVRPFELFNAYARDGHRVHIWETDGISNEERVYHNGNLRVKPLKNSFGILSLIPQMLEMRRTLRDEILKAKEEGFTNFCFYNQVPAAVVFRFRCIPLLTQPGILLINYARKLGMKVWGNMHDISPEHELGALERVSDKIITRSIRILAFLHSQIQKVFIPKCDFVTTGSLAMKEAIIERYNYPSEQVTVMGSAYNSKLIEPIKPWAPPKTEDQWTVAYLGSHIDASLELLVKALNIVNRDNVKLLLAGKGMKDAVSAHEISWKNTEVINDTTYSEFSAIANKVDIWAVPLTDWVYLEIAWPLKMSMYLASGRPIIRTQGKALNDSGLAEHFYATGKTAEEFATTLISIIDNPEEASLNAQNARDAVVDSLSWEKISQKMLSELEKVHS